MLSSRGGGVSHRVIAASAVGLAFCSASAYSAERAIEKSVTVPASVDAVWEAWTTRAGIVSFFAPDAEIDARVGGAFHIHMDPSAESGMKGADDMRFMALQPKRMLSFDWNAPPSLPEARKQRTFVIVRLAPVTEQRTLVTLTHLGWGDGGEWDKTYAYFDRAWGGVLGNLKLRFEKGPQDWTEWLAQVKRAREAAKRPAP
ncbi:MAG: SRPBCC domain-containing protein [Burkholderiales bacterium]|nr:SRPBCC domain-containing protein [Burkholderiales bacterium]